MTAATYLIFDSEGQPFEPSGEFDLVIDSAEFIQQQNGETLSERIERVAKEFTHAKTIGIRFDKFTDGRSYSIAARLREAGCTADLHAMGDINQEIIFLLKRVGFTHFHIPDPGTAELSGHILRPFAGHYQAAQDGTRAPWQTSN